MKSASLIRSESKLADGPVRGRGAGLNPTPRFDRLSLQVLEEHWEQLASETHVFEDGRRVRTEVFRDTSKSLLMRSESPDIGGRWSMNAYRGCEHGCIYCFARPGHEYFGLSSGLDFETKIFAKPDAPELLRKELSRNSWQGEPIMMSGVTDCYQPVEAKLGITRRCLEVLNEFGQPVSIITKSRLILRDIDILSEMARRGIVHVAVSVTSIDNELATRLEPRASSPRDRLWAIRRLSSAGIPVVAMVAPVIPAVTDRQIPSILKAAADAGAASASYVLLRLPYALKELLEDWLGRHMPDRREHVLALLRQCHGGKLYDSAWGQRMTGTGPYAQQLQQTFKVFARRYGLDRELPPFNREALRRPAEANQMRLFEALN